MCTLKCAQEPLHCIHGKHTTMPEPCHRKSYTLTFNRIENTPLLFHWKKYINHEYMRRMSLPILCYFLYFSTTIKPPQTMTTTTTTLKKTNNTVKQEATTKVNIINNKQIYNQQQRIMTNNNCNNTWYYTTLCHCCRYASVYSVL